MWSPTGMSTSASSGRFGDRGPTLPAHVHGLSVPPARSSRATDSMPKVSRTRSSRASRLVSPRSTLPARKERISDWRAAGPLVRTPGGEVHDGGHGDGDPDEDRDGDDVLRVGVVSRCSGGV